MSNFVILACVTLTCLTVGTLSLAASPPTSAGSAAEATVTPSPALTHRAEQVVRLINGETGADRLFAPDFLARVPAERLTRMAATVRARHGPAIAVTRIEAETPNSGTIYLELEKMQMPVELSLADLAPHLVKVIRF